MKRLCVSAMSASLGRLASLPRCWIEWLEAARAKAKCSSQRAFGSRHGGVDIGAVENVAGAVGVDDELAGTSSAGWKRSWPCSSYQTMPRSPSVTPPIRQPRLLR